MLFMRSSPNFEWAFSTFFPALYDSFDCIIASTNWCLMVDADVQEDKPCLSQQHFFRRIAASLSSSLFSSSREDHNGVSRSTRNVAKSMKRIKSWGILRKSAWISEFPDMKIVRALYRNLICRALFNHSGQRCVRMLFAYNTEMIEIRLDPYLRAHLNIYLI